MRQCHASAVVIDAIGVLLRGPSGGGKSDLALRLIDGGAALVADDRVQLAREGAAVVMRAPSAIAGLIEVRGLGILTLPAVDRAVLGLVVDLVAEEVARMPEPAEEDVLGLPVTRIALHAFEASAAAKVRIALRCAVAAKACDRPAFTRAGCAGA